MQASPTLTQRVEASLEVAQAEIRADADNDGEWRTAYKAGPYESLMTSIGLNYIGHQAPGFYEEEKDVLKGNLSYQTVE